jgi:hypothetical protein
MHPKTITITITIVTILSGVMLWLTLFGGVEEVVTVGATEEFLGIVTTPLQSSSGGERFRVSTTDASLVTVELPTARLRDCVAYDAISEYQSVVVGAQVSVRGRRQSGNTIVPCAQSDHFVRVLSIPAPILSVPEPSTDLRATVLRTVDSAYPEATSIAITSFESRQWSDSCLGLGGPAESCLSEPVEGYYFVVEVDNRLLTYRSNESGSQLRAE